MSLNFVTPNPDPHMNALIYGPPKTGKSTGAGSAPGPVLYLNADRPNATRFVHQKYGDAIREVKIEGLETLIEVAAQTVEKPDEWASIVLDPIGEVYRTILEGISGRALSPKIQEYGDTGTHLERFCRHLCELPMNAVFVAHETSVKDEASGTFERLPWTGTNNPAFGAKLMAMVDVIGYSGVVSEEGKEPRYMAQLVNANGRRGGARAPFNVLGTARDLDLSEWISLAKQSTTAQQKAAQKEGAKK